MSARIQALLDSPLAGKLEESDWVDIALIALDHAGLSAVDQDDLTSRIRRYYWCSVQRRDSASSDARAQYERDQDELASGLETGMDP